MRIFAEAYNPLADRAFPEPSASTAIPGLKTIPHPHVPTGPREQIPTGPRARPPPVKMDEVSAGLTL